MVVLEGVVGVEVEEVIRPSGLPFRLPVEEAFRIGGQVGDEIAFRLRFGTPHPYIVVAADADARVLVYQTTLEDEIGGGKSSCGRRGGAGCIGRSLAWRR